MRADESGKLARGAGVEAFELAAEHRAIGDRGEDHVGASDIDAVLRAAVDLGRDIDALERAADETPGEARLQSDMRRRRGTDRRARERAISRAALRRAMTDHAVLRLAARWIDTPGRGCGGDQHRPRHRARLAWALEAVDDRGRAAGDLLRHRLGDLGRDPAVLRLGEAAVRFEQILPDRDIG